MHDRVEYQAVPGSACIYLVCSGSVEKKATFLHNLGFEYNFTSEQFQWTQLKYEQISIFCVLPNVK